MLWYGTCHYHIEILARYSSQPSPKLCQFLLTLNKFQLRYLLYVLYTFMRILCRVLILTGIVLSIMSSSQFVSTCPTFGNCMYSQFSSVLSLEHYCLVLYTFLCHLQIRISTELGRFYIGISRLCTHCLISLLRLPITPLRQNFVNQLIKTQPILLQGWYLYFAIEETLQQIHSYSPIYTRMFFRMRAGSLFCQHACTSMPTSQVLSEFSFSWLCFILV